MSIMYYCGIKKKDELFEASNFKYDILGYSKGFVDSNYWLLFTKEDEVERGYCECSTEKCIETIDKTLKYIKENLNKKVLNNLSSEKINDTNKFLMDKRSILQRYKGFNIAFDFSDKVYHTLRKFFDIEELKGLEILNTKKKLIYTLQGKMNIALDKKDIEFDYDGVLRTTLNELVEEINSAGIIELKESYYLKTIHYPNNKTLVRNMCLLKNVSKNAHNDIDFLMCNFSSILKRYNATYTYDFILWQVPEKYHNLKEEYHIIELSILK